MSINLCFYVAEEENLSNKGGSSISYV